MPRGRALAIAGLPLLAALLAAQAPAVPPTKPAALAAQQKKIEAQQKKAEAEAERKAAAAAEAQKKAEAAAEKKAAAAAAAQKKAEAAAGKKAAAEQKKAATAAQPKKNEAKAAPPKYALADYYRVWGVGAETTRKDIVARFGEPQRTGDSERKPFYYFNDTLAFFFSKEDTVETMIVGNSFSAIAPNTIPPEVVDKAFIGRKRDDVLKTFGPAQVVSSENYRYLPKSGAYKIEFQCYDFKGYVCGQMLVQF